LLRAILVFGGTVLASLGCATAARVAASDPPAAEAATTKTVVAVFDIEDEAKTLDSGTAAQLANYLAARVAEVLRYRVVPRDQLRNQLRDQKAEAYRPCFDESCQIELGKAVAAQKSLATRVMRIGDTCAMSSTIFDLKTETTERAATTKTACSDAELIAAVDGLVDQLKGSAEKLGRPPVAVGGGSDQVATCRDAVQGKIPWNVEGDTRWAPANVDRLCRGGVGDEPARCMVTLMRGQVNWGGGTRWEWENAVNLCHGAQDAKANISCFEGEIQSGIGWRDAISHCARP
jgi:hypothetical protein